MPQAYNKIFKFNQEQKLMKISFVIYADTESLLERNALQILPTKLFTSKMNKHTTYSYSFFTQCSFDSKKNKL